MEAKAPPQSWCTTSFFNKEKAEQIPYWFQGSFVCAHCAANCRQRQGQDCELRQCLTFKFECQCRQMEGGCSAPAYEGAEDPPALEAKAKEMLARQTLDIAQAPV